MYTVVTSGKAAPGVSTSVWALALGCARPVLAADCDPAGGDMAPGLLAGRLLVDRGLLAWSTLARRGTPALTSAAMLAQFVAQLPERELVWFLPGFTNATQGGSFTQDTWERLALTFERVPAVYGRDVIVDAGRVVGERGNFPLVRAADQVLLAVRPSVRSVHAAQDALVKLRYELGDVSKVAALAIGEGPYPAGEIAKELGLPLVGHLPADPRAAAVLSDGARMWSRFGSSSLMKAASRVASRLGQQWVGVEEPGPATTGAAR
jgi:hypothetical protein